MATHKYTSWGRTRRPKPAGGEGNYITGSGPGDSATGAAAGIPCLTPIGAGSPSDGVYKTESQRYLHLHCTGSTSGVSNVYVYMYSANSWSELMTVNPTDGSRDAVACGANQHVVVDLKGADLVAFVTSSSTVLKYGNFAAFSTF
jgi:hypothetical protein